MFNMYLSCKECAYLVKNLAIIMISLQMPNLCICKVHGLL